MTPVGRKVFGMKSRRSTSALATLCLARGPNTRDMLLFASSRSNCPRNLPLLLKRLDSTSLRRGRDTIFDAVKSDHKDLKHLYDACKRATTEEEDDQWTNAFTWAMVRHAAGEDIVLYPGMVSLGLSSGG
jgi:hypothetical protein